MIEYYEEALLEAILFCMVSGVSEDYVLSCDVDGFRDLYKYMKRLDARRKINDMNSARMAANAGKRDYGKALEMYEIWLPVQEKSNRKKSAEQFKRDFFGKGK